MVRKSVWFGLLLSSVVMMSTSAEPTRLNKMVELLASDKPVFGVFSGEKTPSSAVTVSRNEEADFIFYSMEQGPFDVPGMQVYMQFLLDRAHLVGRRTLLDEHPVLTRIPPIRDGRVEAQDRTKRILDGGVYGVVFPHVESREDAELAVRSIRYRPNGARAPEVGDAPRYWGVTEEEYKRRADIWPLNPDGELINMILIEDKVGIANAREIVSTPGVSVVIPGPGDLRRAYEGDGPAIENAIQTVLAACKEFNVACGITAGPDDIEKRLDEGFRVFITGGEALTIGRRASGRD